MKSFASFLSTLIQWATLFSILFLIVFTIGLGWQMAQNRVPTRVFNHHFITIMKDVK